MRNKIIVLSILIFFLFTGNVSAASNTCYYETSEGKLTISYDDSNGVTDIDIDQFNHYISHDFEAVNVLGLIKVGAIQKTNIEIDVNSESCPVNMYVVVELGKSINSESFKSIIKDNEARITLIKQIINSSFTKEDLSTYFGQTFALVEGTYKIYLMDGETFNKSPYKKHENSSGFEVKNYLDRYVEELENVPGIGVVAKDHPIISKIITGALKFTNPVFGAIQEVVDFFVADTDNSYIFKMDYYEVHLVTNDEYKHDEHGNTDNGVDVNCTFFSDAFNIYKEQAKTFAGCTTDYCKRTAKKEMSKQKSIMRKGCTDILKSYSYGDDAQRSCVTSCYSLNKNLSSIDAENKINSGAETKCYLSEGGRNFLKNIIKWVKLILPVLLIILSIFDFLRAIANEDEGMKRAKKHLINRLIAIALIYTMPSFIQFFLERFGFVYSECSILMIKLLK